MVASRRKLRGKLYRRDSVHRSRDKALNRASKLRGWGYRASVRKDGVGNWVVWKK